MTAQTRSTPLSDLNNRLINGALAGLAGGLVFGAMMAMMGMMAMIAGLAGSDSAAVGFVIHLVISAFIGATFGLLLGNRVDGTTTALGWGALYGFVWWILGPLLIMPAMMGMPLFMINGMTMMSLVGHLIYGAVTGYAFLWLLRR